MPGFQTPSPRNPGDMQLDPERGYAAAAVMHPPVGLTRSAAPCAGGLTLAATRPGALVIDAAGLVQDPKVKPQISAIIEHGAMKQINGIIVHQTGGATAQSALDSYKIANANGAHFLIDKDGTIYQTATRS